MDPRPTDFRQFRTETRRYAPAVLLPVLARLSHAQLWEQQKPLHWVYPWVGAAAARECIGYSNEYRGPAEVEVRHLRRLGDIAGNLRDPFLTEHGTPDALASFIVRMINQQGPFNEFNPYAEMTRMLLVCGGDDAEYERLGLQVIREQTWSKLLGMPLIDYARAAFVIAAFTRSNQGMFYPKQLEASALAPLGIDAEQVKTVFYSLADTLARHRDNAKRRRSDNPDLLHLDFNPLMAKPFVEINTDVYVAPCAHFLLNRMSVQAMYHLGVRKHGDAFASDIGKLAERYVGRQLAQLPHDLLLPELPYELEGNEAMTIATGSCRLAASAPSLRSRPPPSPMRLFLGYQALEEALEPKVGYALHTQIPRTADRIRDGRKPFEDHRLPADVVGIMATVEQFFTMHSDFFRDMLPDPGVPYTVLSLRELEWFIVAILSGLDVADLIQRITTPSTGAEAAISAAARDAGIELRRTPCSKPRSRSSSDGSNRLREATFHLPDCGGRIAPPEYLCFNRYAPG
jgi:hypothetical protein